MNGTGLCCRAGCGRRARPLQAERAAGDLAEQVERLVARGQAYPCFCTDEELAAMKADAEARNLPPIYRGRWARASAEEVRGGAGTRVRKLLACLA